ncbi:MAG: D-alanyl-D-alanine carboxypeptidase family protein [Pseudomonadota bacterium]
MPAIRLRSPVMLSGAFLALASVYAAYFDIAIRTDADAAEARFHALVDHGAPRRAASHGERAIALRRDAGAKSAEVAALKVAVADAQSVRSRHGRAADLLQDALASPWGRELSVVKRIAIEDRLARANMQAGDVEKAAAIYASFLELAGDAASSADEAEYDPVAVVYAETLADAGAAFLRVVNHAKPREIAGDTPEHKLASATQFADLGGYFATRESDAYAAAGLLATAYETRKRILGGDHQDTVQLTLMLGPLYAEMGRLQDAERLYLEAFHAQERVKGANSPDLSLYIKLLAGVYESQERYTEAQALYEHMRGLFRDAFGAQRYSVNREQDRREFINRPVSQFFPIQSDYSPVDLVSAAEFYVPTAKGPNIDEMKLRLAPDEGQDAREANLPARLAQLISLCRSESGQAISLRSGYRSFNTQAILHQLNGDKGTVTPPGVSEHQTGLAADINVDGRFMRQSDRAYQCFEENAFRFGFILSYPPGNDYLPGNDSYEPWHWRYVGIQTAQLYREAGPHNRPQEFLAALPCYQERAASGVFPTAGEPDMCLDGKPAKLARMESEKTPAQRKGDDEHSARILNDPGGAGLKR